MPQFSIVKEKWKNCVDSLKHFDVTNQHGDTIVEHCDTILQHRHILQCWVDALEHCDVAMHSCYGTMWIIVIASSALLRNMGILTSQISIAMAPVKLGDGTVEHCDSIVEPRADPFQHCDDIFPAL